MSPQNTNTTREAGGGFRQPGWLWLLMCSAILTQSGVQLLRPVTSYQLLDLGYGEAEIATTTAVFALLPLFLALPLGRMTGKLSDARAFIISGVLLVVAGGLTLALAHTVAWILIGSAVMGLGQLLFTLTGQSIISSRASSTGMDAGFGWFTAAFAVGQMLGPLLSGIILGPASGSDGDGWSTAIRWALWAGTISALLAVPLLLGLRPQQRRKAGQKIHQASESQEAAQGPQTASLPVTMVKPTVWRILSIPGIPAHMLASMSLLVMLDILVAFMPLLGEYTGVSPLVIGALLSVRGAASVISRIFLPILSGRFRRNVLIFVSVAGSCLAIALVPQLLGNQTGQMTATFVAMIIGGFFLGLGQPLTMTQVSQAVPVNWRSTALAVRLVGNRIGQVVMPLAAGALAAPFGPGAGIWFACGLLGISAVERVAFKRLGPDIDEQD